MGGYAQNKRILILAIIILVFASLGDVAGEEAIPLSVDKFSNKPIKIGFSLGWRNHVIYRAYINDYFNNEGIDVKLYTMFSDRDGWYEVPKEHAQVNKIITETMKVEKFGNSVIGLRKFCIAPAIKIIDAVNKGYLAGGTVGSSAFINALTNGSTIVAVAMLGEESTEKPTKAILVRKDIVIKSPQDFKGKVFVSRKSGHGDGVFLKEFIESIGLDPKKDVTIIEQVREDELINYLITKKADAVLYHAFDHTVGVDRIEAQGIAYIYQVMHWVNPEISHSLLVFRKDFIEAHPDAVLKIGKESKVANDLKQKLYEWLKYIKVDSEKPNLIQKYEMDKIKEQMKQAGYWHLDFPRGKGVFGREAPGEMEKD